MQLKLETEKPLHWPLSLFSFICATHLRALCASYHHALHGCRRTLNIPHFPTVIKLLRESDTFDPLGVGERVR